MVTVPVGDVVMFRVAPKLGGVTTVTVSVAVPVNMDVRTVVGSWYVTDSLYVVVCDGFTVTGVPATTGCVCAVPELSIQFKVPEP